MSKITKERLEKMTDQEINDLSRKLIKQIQKKYPQYRNINLEGSIDKFLDFFISSKRWENEELDIEEYIYKKTLFRRYPSYNSIN